VLDESCVCIGIVSDQQGFGNPCRYMGKGWEGRGQGMECLTPHKPLPLSEGKGIPSLLLAGKSHDVCPITNMLSTNKQSFSFSTTTVIATTTTVSPPSPPTTTSGNCCSTTPHHHCTPEWWWQCGNAMLQAPYAHHFRWHMVKMTWHVNGHATLSRWWWWMLSSLSTILKVSNLTPHPLYSHEKCHKPSPWPMTSTLNIRKQPFTTLVLKYSDAEHNNSKKYKSAPCSSACQDSFPLPWHRLLTIIPNSDSDSLTLISTFIVLHSQTLYFLILLSCTIITFSISFYRLYSLRTI